MIKPAPGRLLVKPKKTESKGGIIIPDTVSEEAKVGIIVDPGDYKYAKAGDILIFAKWGHDIIEIEGEKFYLVSDKGILGTYEAN